MALFKQMRGNRASLDSQPLHDGYAYFCVDDGTFHIDYEDADGVLQRKQINAKDAEALTGVSLEELRNEIAAQDAVVLAESQAYADSVVNEVNNTINTQDAMILAEAQKYADSIISLEIGAIFTNGSIGLKYAIYDDHAEFIGLGDCTDASVEIASIVQGRYVTVIGDNAFDGGENIEEIIIPKHISYIGVAAFGDCAPTVSLSYKGTIEMWKAIDKNEAWGGGGCIVYCINGITRCVSEGLEYTLADDGESYSVTGIGTCTDIEIVIPATYNGIPVTSIGSSAFRDCTTITEVLIPDSLESIEPQSYRQYSLRRGDANENYWITIGDYAFYGCSSLENMTIPATVSCIGDKAFGDCTSLKTITIPETVSDIGEDVFTGCMLLTIYCEAEENDNWGSSWNSDCFVYWETDHVHVEVIDETVAPTCTEDGYIITKCSICGVEMNRVNGEAATGHTNTTTTTVDATCTEAGSITVTCDDCGATVSTTVIDAKGHTEEVIPAVNATCTEAGLTEGKKCSVCGEILVAQGTVPAFKHNYQITTTEPTATEDGVITYTCDSCGYTYTESITPIAFTVTSSNRSQIGYTGQSGEKLEIPAVFKKGGTWYRVTSISEHAFSSCESLTSVVIPDSVTSIDSYAFYCCTSLTSVAIPDSVTIIGNGAFYGCANFESIIIPDSVTSIGGSAFYRCFKLTDITVNKNNPSYTSIDGNLYSRDEKTLIQYAVGKIDAEFVIPDNTVTIEHKAFYGCDSLASVVIGNGVESIGMSAFDGCSSLTSVVIGDSVTSIGAGAFRDCASLTDVYYTGSEEEWQAISIGNNNSALTSATIHYNWEG